MKLLGAHMSIEGGVDQSVERGALVGCDAIQLFTHNSNQWRARPLDPGEVARFRSLQIEKGISPTVAHASYLINLASPDPALYARSRTALGEELDRCEALGIPYLVIHLGSHMGSGEAEGIGRVAAALDRLLEERPDHAVKVLLETSAGQGQCVGHRFEHLRDILGAMSGQARAGVCLDTCHVFAAGYDLRTEDDYRQVMQELDATVGLARVRVFHLNDCKKDLGCRVDRHEHIGRGFLGVEPFRLLLADPRFDGLPMLLETPKGKDMREDRENLAVLRGLLTVAR
ncbi:MAG: deoxyribonuclease IV [Candidatus Polarisedimenticolia bacterium]